MSASSLRARLVLMVAASVAVPGPARADGTRLLVVSSARAPEALPMAVRLEAAAVRALAVGSRFDVQSLEAARGGAAWERAQRELEAAGKKVQAGRQAVHDLRVGEAAVALDAAIAVYKEQVAYVADVSTFTQALVYLGGIHLLQQQTVGGRKALAMALALDPAVEPDPTIFNPPMLKEFADLREHLKTTSGSVAVTSTPPGARAFVDGRFVGVTPTTTSGLNEGAHLVRVVDDSHKAWGKLVEVVAQAEVGVSAKLDLLPEVKGLDEALVAVRSGAERLDPSALDRLSRLLDIGQVAVLSVGPSAVAANGKLGAPVEVRLVGVATGAVLASARRLVGVELSNAELAAELRELFEVMKPPPLAYVVGAVRSGAGVRNDMERALRKATSEAFTEVGYALSFAPTPLSDSCFAEAACVQKTAAGVGVDGILALELKRSGKHLVIGVTAYAARSGERVARAEVQLAPDKNAVARAVTPLFRRAADALWEASVAESKPATASPAPPTDAVPATPTPEPAPREPANPSPTPPTSSGGTTVVAAAPATTSTPGPLTPPRPGESPTWPTERLVGVGLGSLGLVVALVGGIVAANRSSVLGNPDSSGDAKASARAAGIASFCAAGVGLLAAGAGGFFTWDSF